MVADLQVVGLAKAFGRGGPLVVDDVSFEVPRGKLFTLLGPSGCGKTTTLRCIAGLEQPTKGDILIGGECVSSVGNRVFVPPEKRGIGMVFQSYAVWPHLSVAENVAFPLRVRRLAGAEVDRRVSEVLDLVGLGGLEHRSPSALSGGQQQRVALARALVFNPRLLLFDEPLSNLDAKLRERMRLEIRRLQKEVNISSVYVTHDQAEALTMSDVVIVMNHGRIQQVGHPRSIYQSPANEFVAGFIGAANLLQGEVAGHLDDPRSILVAVEVAPGRRTQIECAAPVALDSMSVVVVVRPEDVILHLQPPESKVTNLLTGRIESLVYSGNSTEYITGVGQLSWRIHTHPSISAQPGETVYLELPPEACRCIPGTPDQQSLRDSTEALKVKE